MRQKICPHCKGAFNVPDGKKRSYCTPCNAIKSASAARRLAMDQTYVKAKRAAFKAANPGKSREYNARAYAKNPELHRERSARHKRENPAIYQESNARRRAIKKMAVPLWADRQAILKIYQEAARLTIETGIIHHVDHIVPISSKLVCGLHWHGNLQVLTAQENLLKKNYHWPGMFGEQKAA